MAKPRLMKVSPEQFARAIAYFEAHGWDRWGVVLVKGGHTVTLTFDMAIEVGGDPDTIPAEVLHMVNVKGREH